MVIHHRPITVAPQQQSTTPQRRQMHLTSHHLHNLRPISASRMHQPPLDPNRQRIPRIPIVNPLENPILPTLPPENINGTFMSPSPLTIPIHRIQLDHLRIPIHAHLKTSYLVLETDDFGAAARGEVETFFRAEFCRVRGRHGDVPTDPDCLTNRFENGRGETARDIRSQAHRNAFVEVFSDGRAAGCQRRV